MSFAKPTRIVTYTASAQVEDEDKVLYTCPSNCRGMMTLLFFSNANGNTTVDVNLYRQNGTEHIHIVGGKNMVGGEFVQFSNGIVVLEPGDYMTITASGNTTPHIDAMCTVEEVFIPVG